jgi:hypothetical protein
MLLWRSGSDFDGRGILTAAALVLRAEGCWSAVQAQFTGITRVISPSISPCVTGIWATNSSPSGNPALSTVDEARADIRELRKLGAHRYCCSPAPGTAARAGRIFRREGPRPRLAYGVRARSLLGQIGPAADGVRTVKAESFGSSKR